ncbi:MAG: HAMP domain-containing histidine kinase [Lachnospiraceae bacterium]|nr:HAMP domain-containing histidine kinase [Lachnospiraceae bacterium]
MFKQSRRKIVASIMAILVFLWAGTLCVIYGSSYLEVSRKNREMLSRHVELYKLPENASPAKSDGMPRSDGAPDIPGRGFDEGENKPGPTLPHFEDTPAFQLSTFYSVAVSDSGTILSTANPKPTVHSSESLEEMALSIIENGQAAGVQNHLIYRTAQKGDYVLVAFMDNTIVQESMTTLFRYTLIFGGLAILALFFLAVYLAKKIVEPLEESYQRQKQFISDAGHELKTPVSVIGTNAELLSREVGDNLWLSNIQYENKRMGALITQLLELARMEYAAPPMEPVDFSRLVAGEALPFESLMFEHGLTFFCDIAKDVSVYGNSTQLKQIVAILLDNALQHCSFGKEVALALRKDAYCSAILTVCNDGEPIPLSQQEQIFERFYRRDPARTGETSHYGLGLAIAKAITLSHDGGIGVHCHDGKITFTVRLPLFIRRHPSS